MPDDIGKYSGRGQTLAANNDCIGEIVGRAAKDAERMTNSAKVTLSDIDRIQKIAVNYLREAADGAFLPSVTGIAARLGCTRQNLYAYAKTHPDSPFDLWLQSFSDLCGEAMMEAAMRGSVKEVSAIFSAKSRYGWRDNLTLEIAQPDRGPLHSQVTPDEIAQKWAELPD